VKRQVGSLLAPLLLLVGCSSGPAFVATTPSAASSTSAATTPSGFVPSTAPSSVPSSPSAPLDDAVVIVGTGDIAEGGTSTMANATSSADLVRAAKPRFVFTVGDNAYPNGSAADFAKKYDPTWGPFKAMTHPVPGNHEYHSTSPSGYLGYFGAANVTNRVDGGVYYAYNVGKAWRAYALNSEVSMSAGSAQYAWLKSDLNAHPGTHFIAYWHQPRFVSKVQHGDRTDEAAIWDLLRLHGTDIVMAGHEHHAERFAKMDGSGALDPKGIREFITGNGGNQTYGLPSTLASNSKFANGYDYGVLKLTLHVNSYDWAFIASGRAYNGSSSVNTTRKGLVLDSGTAATNVVNH
jgi:acid phosphatase type 7